LQRYEDFANSRHFFTRFNRFRALQNRCFFSETSPLVEAKPLKFSTINPFLYETPTKAIILLKSLFSSYKTSTFASKKQIQRHEASKINSSFSRHANLYWCDGADGQHLSKERFRNVELVVRWSNSNSTASTHQARD
jgi:hypothetical protein